jgi:hypothetical protein
VTALLPTPKPPARKKARGGLWLMLGVLGVPLTATLCVVGLVVGAALLFTPPPSATTAGVGCPGQVAYDGDVAATLARVAAAANADATATLALFEAAIVESGVKNLDRGDRDSLGVLQQRPSAGWGTPAQVRDPAYAARAFLLGPKRAGATKPNLEPGAIARVRQYPTRTAGQIAQTVQRSAYPHRYDRAEARARTLIAQTANAAAGVTCEPELPQGTGQGAGPWGGFQNGQIPRSALAPIGAGHYLRADAAQAWVALQQAARHHFGAPIGVTSSYRSYAQQVVLKRTKGGLAATPGQSNHGWGLALDLIDTGFGSPRYDWLRAVGPQYGWVHPDWAQAGGSNPEAWHWEYHGTR